MKKFVAVLLAVLLTAAMFSACVNRQAAQKDDGKLRIVTTIFPVYDWVREITRGQEQTELTMLLDDGVDLHSYQPTADDLVKINSCDLFIYVGGESDQWVDDVLKNTVNKEMKTVNLLTVLGNTVKEEEVKEGMQAEEEEDSGEEAPEYDEHVWLSLINTQALVSSISEILASVDTENAELYQQNAKEYSTQLAELDTQYRAVTEAASVKTLLFGDRFPFRYMTDDYGLDYYAAFVGCSAESEASFETVSFLAKKLDELNLKYVIVIEGSDGKLANTIIDNSAGKSAEILTLNSMQATTMKQVEEGATYLAIMQSNLEVLKQALS